MEKKTVKMICEDEHIPHQFAYKILKKLEHAGIVRSYRGTLGGYQLDKELNCITLSDIVLAVDDNLFINECLQPGYECPNNCNSNSCNVHHELVQIQNSLTNALNNKTFDKYI